MGETILMPARAEHFDLGRPAHRLADELLAGRNGNLRRELENACGLNFLACIIRANGEGAF